MFPNNVTPDVFLSHSFNDYNTIKPFTEFLRSRGLNVFIDSEVWGSVYDLLREVDNKYCYSSSSNTYDYNMRNKSTANIYMILNSALHSIIASTEAFIFIKSSSSLSSYSTKEIVLENNNNKTYSPWIHSELLFTSQARKNIPTKLENKNIFESKRKTVIAMDSFPNINHTAPLSHLIKLDKELLYRWISNNKYEGCQLLDDLYLSEGLLE